MGSNTPELYEAHFGIPMTGAVLNALNIRLDAAAIAFILDHGEAKVLFADKEFSKTIQQALEIADVDPIVIDVDDAIAPTGELLERVTMRILSPRGIPISRGSCQKMSGMQFP